MDLGIEGKTALVMGAGGGLGGAIARGLAHEGCRLVVADVDFSAAQATAATVTEAGGTATALEWDLGDRDAIDTRLAEAVDAAGTIDILVNNSGGPRPAQTHDITDEEWASHFQSMVLSLVKLTRLVIPGMRSKGWGRIITSASSGVVAPIPGLAVSNALRLALVGWSKSLSQEVAKDGITVNVAIPGRIATRRIESLDESRAKAAGTTKDAIAAASTAAIPIGRYGDPDEYAAAVAFLASQRASYITGTMLRVDGGLVASL